MSKLGMYVRRTCNGTARLTAITPSTKLILQAADSMGISWRILPFTQLLELSYQGESVVFHHQIPPQTTSVADYSCKQKHITRNLLLDAGLTVSPGYQFLPSDSQEYLLQIYKKLAKPLVVKPANASQGAFVHLNVITEEDLLVKVAAVQKSNPQTILLIEEQFTAPEYRVLCSPERVISVIKRVPPNVVGDGIHTISELAIAKSTWHAKHPSPALKPLLLDQTARSYLAREKRTLDTIPKKGERVYLQDHALLAINRGGDTVEVLPEVHHSVIEIALRAVQAVPGLAWAGIDFMSVDHSIEQAPDTYRIIEVNASPSLDWQEFPAFGSPQPVVQSFLQVLFPDLSIITAKTKYAHFAQRQVSALVA